MKCQLAACGDRRPRKGLGVPPYTIINPSVKRQRSVEPFWTIVLISYEDHESTRRKRSISYLILVTQLYLLVVAVGSLVVRASDSRPEGLVSMPVSSNTLRVHTDSMPKLWRWKIGGAAIYRPFGNFSELNRTFTHMVLGAKANDRRTSSPLPR
ncbi:hypothetical protein TNCV_851351 [Trichonephila clavipes]|nr:hypothetical protein TNCV_851351 [Trichonephila clavipes]